MGERRGGESVCQVWESYSVCVYPRVVPALLGQKTPYHPLKPAPSKEASKLSAAVLERSSVHTSHSSPQEAGCKRSLALRD